MTDLDERGNTALIDCIDQLGAQIEARQAIARSSSARDRVLDETLITLLSGGHLLLIGVPGLGKTRLVETLGTVFGLEERRVQFTPDLMPADILGSEVLEEVRNRPKALPLHPGAGVLSATDGRRDQSGEPAHAIRVVAGHAGARSRSQVITTACQDRSTSWPRRTRWSRKARIPLPEAQLDRFFMQVDVDYPDLDAERQVLIATTGPADEAPRQVMNGAQLLEAQRLIRHVPVGESVVEAILELVRAGRPEISQIDEVKAHVSWGPGRGHRRR